LIAKPFEQVQVTAHGIEDALDPPPAIGTLSINLDGGQMSVMTEDGFLAIGREHTENDIPLLVVHEGYEWEPVYTRRL